jgi:hypothetical protein
MLTPSSTFSTRPRREKAVFKRSISLTPPFRAYSPILLLGECFKKKALMEMLFSILTINKRLL